MLVNPYMEHMGKLIWSDRSFRKGLKSKVWICFSPWGGDDHLFSGEIRR
jgi:hypothetical protein